MSLIFFINGSFVSEKDARIAATDLGLLRGYGIFEYFRTYGGKPFHLYDHLIRLKSSAEHIGMPLPYSLEEFAQIVEKVIEKNRFIEAGIKIIVTGGESSDQLFPENKPSVLVLIAPFHPYAARFYELGIKLISTTLPRSIPQAKTTHYIPAIVSLKKAKEKGGDDALFLGADGEILESTTSNFFAFIEDRLVTSSSNEILLGITREVICKISPFEVEIRPIFYKELPSFTEAFICSSSREIMPVTEIDGQKIGSGQVGSRTKELQKLFTTYTESATWDSAPLQG